MAGRQAKGFRPTFLPPKPFIGPSLLSQALQGLPPVLRAAGAETVGSRRGWFMPHFSGRALGLAKQAPLLSRP